MSSTAIHELIRRGALVVCNSSGGKDSQAMYLLLRDLFGLALLVQEIGDA